MWLSFSGPLPLLKRKISNRRENMIDPSKEITWLWRSKLKVTVTWDQSIFVIPKTLICHWGRTDSNFGSLWHHNRCVQPQLKQLLTNYDNLTQMSNGINPYRTPWLLWKAPWSTGVQCRGTTGPSFLLLSDFATALLSVAHKTLVYVY